MRNLATRILWSLMLFFATFLYSCIEYKKSNDDIFIEADDYHKIKKTFDEKGNLTNSYQVNILGQRDGNSF